MLPADKDQTTTRRGEVLGIQSPHITDRTGVLPSEDADSAGEEEVRVGKSEVMSILGEDGEMFCEFFNVTESGNFEHGNSILNTPLSLEEFAEKKGANVEELRRTINASRQRLFNVRAARVRPGRDDKSLAAWNGLMLTAFAEAANILGRDDYREIAVRNAEFILKPLRKTGGCCEPTRAGRRS